MLRLDDVVDGRALAVARIGIGVSGLLNCLEAWVIVGQVDQRGAIRVSTWEWLPTVTPAAAGAMCALGAVAAVFVLMGLATRPAAGALAGALATMMLLEQQTYSNHVALSMWCALWLVFSRSDARWSLHARVRGPGEVTLADQVLLMSQVSVVYAFTGSLKINAEFLSGRVIQGSSHFDLSDELARAMAVGAVITELGLCVGLWIRRVRWMAAVAGIGLHMSIPIVLHEPLPLLSFSISIVCLYPLFLVSRTTPATPERRIDSHDLALAAT